jgi:hypothetical protein
VIEMTVPVVLIGETPEEDFSWQGECMVKEVVGENPCQRLTSGPESSDTSHQGTARG